MGGPEGWRGEKRGGHGGEEGGDGECGKDVLDVVCSVEAITHC